MPGLSGGPGLSREQQQRLWFQRRAGLKPPALGLFGLPVSNGESLKLLWPRAGTCQINALAAPEPNGFGPRERPPKRLWPLTQPAADEDAGDNGKSYANNRLKFLGSRSAGREHCALALKSRIMQNVEDGRDYAVDLP